MSLLFSVLPASNHPEPGGSTGTNNLWLRRFDSSLAPYIKHEATHSPMVPCSPEGQAPCRHQRNPRTLISISTSSLPSVKISAKKDIRVAHCHNVEKSWNKSLVVAIFKSITSPPTIHIRWWTTATDPGTHEDTRWSYFYVYIYWTLNTRSSCKYRKISSSSLLLKHNNNN